MGLGMAIVNSRGAHPPIDTLAVQVKAPTPNPEPASLLLVGTGIAGLLIRRRRNQA
jgi:hypothetical protein